MIIETKTFVLLRDIHSLQHVYDYVEKTNPRKPPFQEKNFKKISSCSGLWKNRGLCFQRPFFLSQNPTYQQASSVEVFCGEIQGERPKDFQYYGYGTHDPTIHRNLPGFLWLGMGPWGVSQIKFPFPKNPWDVMGYQNHLFWGARGVMNGGSGVSILGVKIVRALKSFQKTHLTNPVDFFLVDP